MSVVNTENLFIKDEEYISFSDIMNYVKSGLSYLKSKYLILLVVAMLGASIGFLKARLTKPTYTASITYVIEGQPSGGSGGFGGLASQFGFNIGGGGASGAGIFTPGNLVELMKSRVLLESVLISSATIDGKTKSLAEFYVDIKELRKAKWNKAAVFPDSLLFPVDSNPSLFSVTQNGLMAYLVSRIGENDLLIKPKNKVSSISVMSFTSENEQFSFIMLQTVIKKLTELYVSTKIKKAKQNVELLQYQVDSVRRELNNSLSSTARANDETFNLNPALNIKKVTSSKKQIDVQTNTSILSQLVQNLEVSKMTLMQETPLIQIIDEPRFPLSVTIPSRLKLMIIFSVILIVLTSTILLFRRWLITVKKTNK